jgi:peptide/nickel transport system ATP-binding protein
VVRIGRDAARQPRVDELEDVQHLDPAVVIEVGPVDELYAHPTHPYTRALLAAMPSMDPDNRTKEAPLAGDPPNPINPPSGCRFHTRCRFAAPMCGEASPPLFKLAADRHFAACHMAVPGSGHPAAVGAAA